MSFCGVERHVRLELHRLGQGTPEVLLTDALEQAAVDAHDQLFGVLVMMDAARQVGVEHRGLAGCRANLPAAELDHLLAADRHHDQRKGVEHAGVDGDVAAVTHAAHADATEATVVDARVDRRLAVLVAQAVLAEDALAPAAGLFNILGVAYLELGQHGVRGSGHGKSQTLHVSFSLYFIVIRRMVFVHHRYPLSAR